MGTEDREWCAGLQTGVFAPWVQRLAERLLLPGGVQEPILAAMSVGLLDVELEPVLLSRAAHLGLPAAWVARMAKLDNQRRQVCTRPPWHPIPRLPAAILPRRTWQPGVVHCALGMLT